jgi:hypothetical protein
MALKKTASNAQGFTAVDAYHRVENVILVGKDRIAFNVRAYKEQGLPFFADENYNCAYELNGSNPIAQAYAHLKSLPEFAGAVDC